MCIMAAKLAPVVELNNGYTMPTIGLGTYGLKKDKGYNAIKHAIDVGYRHFDTAFLYGNEGLLGKAVKEKINEGLLKREEIFLVTKLWNIYHDPEMVNYTVKKQLHRLDVEYIDLYLMHSPVGYKYINDETLVPYDHNVLQLTDVDYVETYKAMEEMVDQGLLKSIGLSNFNSEQLHRILSNCRIKPVTNQIECHPGLNQKKMIEFCKKHNIVVTAYSPLARPKSTKLKPSSFLNDQIQIISKKHNKTIPQIILRYLLDIGTIPIPKSSNPERITENFNIFDFTLSGEEMIVLDNFNDNERLWKFEQYKHHKYWPFNIEV